ncbi:MAG: hypothetical protein ACE5GO_12730 [Anaerolineales bacterium]
MPDRGNILPILLILVPLALLGCTRPADPSNDLWNIPSGKGTPTLAAPLPAAAPLDAAPTTPLLVDDPPPTPCPICALSQSNTSSNLTTP